METHLLAGEGVIRMAPSLFTSGVRPRHKVSKRNFNSGPDPRSKFLGLAPVPTSGEIQSAASDKISHSRVC